LKNDQLCGLRKSKTPEKLRKSTSSNR